MEPGSRLNHYTILGCLGAGAMGEVYRARDERLGREVALKLLPKHCADDPTARRRLEREARLVASMAHPNIAAIHGLEESEGTAFLVLELVEGTTLAERLEQTSFSVREALDVASQIAAAVSAAHERGILHRDLKPGNVMLSDDGRARVLDFGLGMFFEREALATQARRDQEPSPAPARDTTSADSREGSARIRQTTTGSAAGILQGTPPYMSPEQIRGRPLDSRSDIWAVGCILYEMLTGRRAFSGPTIADTLTDILEREPDWDALPASTPESVRLLLSQMLEKTSSRRIQDAADARVLLEGSLSSISGGLAGSPVPVSRRQPLGVAVGVVGPLLVAAGAVLGGVWSSYPFDQRLDSVAVLPFANLTGDPGQDHFADGMTEELTTALGHINALKVVSRSSARSFERDRMPLPEIGANLGVDALVEASLLSAADQIRLSVRLYDAARDTLLWGETYEAPTPEIETIYSRLAQAIAQRLDIELMPEERSRLTRTRAVNPAAADAYLKGRFYYSKARGRSRAIEQYQRALDLDPGYAAAYAALANAYVYSPPSHVHMPAARHAAQTALNLDDTLGEGHAALAQVKFFFDWDWRGAEEGFLRALELDPNSAIVRQRYASLLWATGRIDNALAQLERAQELDPLNLYIKTEIARSHYFARNFEVATDSYERVLDLEPDFWWAQLFLGLTQQQAGQLPESATALVRTQRQLGNDEVADRMQLAYQESGYEALMEEWIADGTTKPEIVQPTSLAAQNAVIGNIDEAFRWLERAFDERTRALVYLAVDPQYDSLRSDPRYDSLLRRMGLSP